MSRSSAGVPPPPTDALSLADVVCRHAVDAPEKAALRFEGEALRYDAFARRIDRGAEALTDRGVRRGDRVAVLAENDPDTLILLYACARIGAILVPLNWRLAERELAYIVQDADPALIVVTSRFASSKPALAAAVPGARIADGGNQGARASRASSRHRVGETSGRLSDPLLLVYTSGTTGRPKGAILTQEALAWNAVMSQHMHGLTAADHVLTVLPFFHVGGLNIQTTPALHQGATVTIHRRFEPGATLAAIAADRPTLTVLVPATLQALIEHPDWATTDLSSLRAVTTGSTYVPQPLVDAFEARGVPVLQVYGATETAPVAITTRLGGERRRVGRTGWPAPFCQAKVVDDEGREVPPGLAGEVWVRGPQVFSGYWRDEAATAEALVDGWFRTGDIATRDPDGAFAVHDRKKNMIVSGGENVYPAEIERVLLQHPDVAEAAVIGRPDPRWGEAPLAFLVPRPGRALDGAGIEAFVLTHLARFKTPRHYTVVDALPRSALGKVQHHLLRERA